MHVPGSVCSTTPQITCIDISSASKNNVAPEDLSSVALCDAFRYELVSLISNNGFQEDPNDADVPGHSSMQSAVAFTLAECAENELKAVQGNDRVRVHLEPSQQHTFKVLFPLLVEAQLQFNARLKSEPDNENIRIKLNGSLNSNDDFFVEKKVNDGKNEIWLTYLSKTASPGAKTKRLMFLAVPGQFDNPIDAVEELPCGEPIILNVEVAGMLTEKFPQNRCVQSLKLPRDAVLKTDKPTVLIPPSSPFSKENHRAICSAVFTGNEKAARALLDQMPELINAQPKTEFGDSLLHVAAFRGYKSICQLLLDKLHETNPVNAKGETPYQIAQQEDIRQLLVVRHKELLCTELYTVSKTSDLVEIVSCQKFSQFLENPRRHTYNNTKKSIFSFTSLTVSESFNNQKNIYHIKTYLREKIFMMPFYGELIIRHANEEAELLLQLVDQHGKEKGLLIHVMNNVTRMSVVREVCYFHRLFVKIMSVFSFVKEPHHKNDRPDITEAKKMFIAFVVHPLVTLSLACTEEDQNFINDHFSDMKFVIQSQLKKHRGNQRYIDEIHQEMSKKYGFLTRSKK